MLLWLWMLTTVKSGQQQCWPALNSFSRSPQFFISLNYGAFPQAISARHHPQTRNGEFGYNATSGGETPRWFGPVQRGVIWCLFDWPAFTKGELKLVLRLSSSNWNPAGFPASAKSSPHFWLLPNVAMKGQHTLFFKLKSGPPHWGIFLLCSSNHNTDPAQEKQLLIKTKASGTTISKIQWRKVPRNFFRRLVLLFWFSGGSCDAWQMEVIS